MNRSIALARPLLVTMLLAGALAISTWGLRAAARGGTLPRPKAPVVVTGSELAPLHGAPADQLVAYRWDGVGWAPVLGQVDIVDGTGTYVYSPTARLDANDELVVMGRDAGLEAPADAWPADPLARLYPRVAIRVTDPLAPGAEGWIYLFRSTTLPRSTAPPLVRWDGAAQRVEALSYTAAFTDAFVGLATLEINGQPVDILDRQKLRAELTISVGGLPIDRQTLDEESVLSFLTQSLTVTLPITGPVRAIGGTGGNLTAFYDARQESVVRLDLSDRQVPFPPFGQATVHVDAVRTSLDLRPPVASGMAPARYSDSGIPAGVMIDGISDTLPAGPPPMWRQVDGALGSLVVLETVDPASGSATRYYEDDATADPDDTGDGMRYGDTGTRVEEPNGEVALHSRLIILPAGTGPVAAGLRQEYDTPLVITTRRESIAAPPSYVPLLLN